MVDIRIIDLPLATGPTAPLSSDVIPIDGTSTRKATISSIGEVAVPIANQSEAEAGVDASKRMTPLTTKQSIAVNAATPEQGAKADTAVQPGSLASVASSGNYSDLNGKPTLGSAASQNSSAFATAAQGSAADAAMPRSGGAFTGAVTGQDGYTFHGSRWFWNEVRDFGATTGAGAAATNGTAFDNTRAAAPVVNVPPGNFRLPNGKALSQGLYKLQHGAALKNSDGSSFTGGINGGQWGNYFDVGYAMEQRGIVMSDTRRFLMDVSPVTAGGDETILSDIYHIVQRNVTAVGNGYTGAATSQRIFQAVGLYGAASGSTGAYQGQVMVGDIKAEAAGRSESIVVSLGLTNTLTGNAYKNNQYVIDAVLAGPIGQQESFLGVYTAGFKKLHGGQLADADHDGAYGYTLEASPRIGGYGSPSVTSYTADVGYACSGHAGAPSVESGADVGANSAWKWSFFSGGRAGVWIPRYKSDGFTPYRSKIDRGFGSTDYVFSGYEAFSAHPSAADPFAFRSAEDAGRVAFGINSPIGGGMLHVGNGTGEFDNNITLYGARHATSKTTRINFRNQFYMGTDPFGNGTEDFFIAQGGQTPIIAIRLNTSGFPFLFFNVPSSAAGLPSGAAYWNNNVLTRVP